LYVGYIVFRSANVVRRYTTDARGGVAITFALLATALFGAIALTVDMARGQNLASRISNALDAAALAGAKALDQGNDDAQIVATVEAYFNAQMAHQRIHNVTMSSLSVSIDKKKSTVKVSINADMGTTFGAMIGKNKIEFAKSSNVVYKARDVELAMALDVTGSMLDGTKLADMRSAAKDVLDTLFAEAKDDHSVRVSVVPWAASVNAGTLVDSVSAGSADGCVVERIDGQTNDSYPSGSSALRAVVAPYGYYSCPNIPVMPLVGKSKDSAIRAVLDGIAPVGGTAGHLGMSWAWYMLSPAWSSIVPKESEPGSYSPQDTVKAVLLLSDGEFNLSYKSGESVNLPAMSNESYQQFQNICAGMKDKKIIVFMVGFGVPDPRAQVEIKACASSDQHYFQAATGADLKAAFKKIALQLKQMRLTQ
jgi:Flp pilus assembly protein TadG